jgi:hypothetical protein
VVFIFKVRDLKKERWWIFGLWGRILGEYIWEKVVLKESNFNTIL